MNKPYEHKWKPVRVAGGSGSGSNKDTGYSISTTSVSSNWYNKQIDVSGNRKTRLQRYYTMDRTSVEISRSLDILAEDISSANADSEEIFNLQYDENTKYPRTVIALLEQMKDLWSERSRMHDEAFSRVRNTLKYGLTVYTREADGNLKYIRPERIVGHILDEHDDTKVTHYIVDPSAPLMQSEDSKRSTFDPARNHDQSTEKKHRVYAVEDLVVLRIGDGPYGESVLDTVFTVWKQMTLIEDAIVIYRVVHAPERRIYYIDTGNLQGPKREQAIERQRLKLMQKQVNRNNQMTSDYDPHSTSESIFIPTNSMGKGSRVETLQGGCFAMDTKVSLLDGRELSIAEIEAEMKEGKTLWTYSVDQHTGKVKSGLISWAGVTQKSAKVMRLTLDNGETIVCTPDHKFPVNGKGFVRADQLDIDESMMPLYRKREKISPKTNDYEMFFDNEDKEWKFTHRMVADDLRGDEVHETVHCDLFADDQRQVRHHIDFNRFNNDPSNLTFMGYRDHAKLHADFGFTAEMQQKGTLASKARLEKMKIEDPDAYADHCRKAGEVFMEWRANASEEEIQRVNDGISTGITEYCAGLSDEEREIRAEKSRAAFRRGNEVFREKLATDPEWAASLSEAHKDAWTDEERKKAAERMSDASKARWNDQDGSARKVHEKFQKIEFSHDMLKGLIDFIGDSTTHQITAEDCCEFMNEHYLDEFMEINKDKRVPNFNIASGFTSQSIKKLPVAFGYQNWRNFRMELKHQNHRITKIEWLDDEIEVGTLTIDQEEKYHDHHTFALSAGIFTKNSNLGNLEDLEYFTKKMAAGLRIPSSMIDTQTDQQNQFSDMRVGQVYQVEMRYMGHIKRISRIFARELNKDFIKFCEDREVEVPKTVKLVFNDPSSYAKYKEIEVQQQLLNLASATTQFPSLSKRFVLEKFMMMDEEEIIKNEEEKLREKGLDSKTIKSMPREHIDNLVYGDGSVGDKYGIKPPEGQGGFY